MNVDDRFNLWSFYAHSSVCFFHFGNGAPLATSQKGFSIAGNKLLENSQNNRKSGIET